MPYILEAGQECSRMGIAFLGYLSLPDCLALWSVEEGGEDGVFVHQKWKSGTTRQTS
jgi:hypothetical protein